MDFEATEVSSVEVWIENASDKFHFLQCDIEETHRAIFGRENDVKESFCPDPALVTSVGQQEEFTGRNLTVVAALAEEYYLARTSVTKNNNIFVVLDARHIGEIVTKFYWNMTFYWSNFGYGMPGGCMPSAIYARYSIMVSCGGMYAIIVGPTEKSSNRRKAMPTAKLLHCCSWKVEQFQLSPEEWPVQVLFDPRSSQEHIAYLIQSSRPWFTLVYQPIKGTLYRYDLHQRKILQQLSPVLSGFVQCLQDGKQLLVIQPNDYPESHPRIQSVMIVDSMTFTPILKVTAQPHNGPLEQVSLLSQMKAFYSADYKKISVVIWERMYKEECIVSNVLTLTPIKTYLPLMTLKEICRATILQRLRIKDLIHIALPEQLKKFLRGL